MIELPWPDAEERVVRRVRSLVASVVRPAELLDVRLEWVTPLAHRFDCPDAGWVALRLTVSAVRDECFQKEIWNPSHDAEGDWELHLEQLASDLEDWVSESAFGWGELRRAVLEE